MYSDLKRKKSKQNGSQNSMVKNNGKKTIMVTLNINPSRVTTNRATDRRNTMFSVTVGLH